MKKLIHTFLLILFGTILTFSVSSQTLSVTSVTNPNYGDVITVSVYATYSTMKSFALYLQYDMDVLTYSSYSNVNAALTGGLPFSLSNQTANSRIYLGWGLFSGTINFSGKICDISFTFKGGQTNLTWDPTNSLFKDANNQSVNPAITNGYVTAAYSSLTTTGGDWTTQSTWTGIGSLTQPNAGHNIQINSGTVTVASTTALCNNLTIKAGAALVINASCTLKIKGNLVIESTATGDGCLLVNGVLNFGTSSTKTVQRYLSGGHYHYVSSPLSNGTYAILQQSPNSTNDFFEWSESSATYPWIDHNDGDLSTTTLTPGKGYAVHYSSNSTKSFTGTLGNGNISINVTKSNATGVLANDNYNLIGNPYPSYLKCSNFVSANTNRFVGNALYFWDENDDIFSSSDYATWNTTGGTGARANTGSIPNGYISPCQGFFVKCNNPGSVSFTNSMRFTNPAITFFKDEEIVPRYWLGLTGPNNKSNMILVGFPDGATNDLDEMYDAPKFSANSQISLYSILNDEKYSIQGFAPLTENLIVPIGFYAGTTGTYSFNTVDFENLPANVSVTLEDISNNELINIMSSNYTFNVNSTGDIDKRFNLHFNIITENYEISGNDLSIYSNESSIFVAGYGTVSGNVEVYDLLGQVIAKEKLSTENITKIDGNFSTGSYVVRVISGKEVFTGKVYVK